MQKSDFHIDENWLAFVAIAKITNLGALQEKLSTCKDWQSRIKTLIFLEDTEQEINERYLYDISLIVEWIEIQMNILQTDSTNAKLTNYGMF